MSVDSIENSIVNTAYNTALSEAAEEKAAENAAEAEVAILKGEGLTVTESSGGTASVARMSAAATPESQSRSEVVSMMFQIAELLESFVGDLQAIATSLGLEAPAEGGRGPVERMDLSSSVKMAKDALGRTNVNHENAAAGASSASSTDDVESTFFSIYSLMALMLEIGQQQRAAAFELSKANLEMSVSSIEAQADKQRRAGEYGMIVGVVTCALQIGVQALAMGMQIKSLNAADKTSAGQKNIEAQNSVRTTAAAMDSSPEAAAKNTKDLESKTSRANRLKVEEGMAESTQARNKCETIQGKITEVENFKNENQTTINDNKATIERNNATMVENQSKVGTSLTQEKCDELNGRLQTRNNDLKAENEKCQSNVDAADDTIKNLGQELGTAKDEYAAALDSDLAKMNEAYDKQAAKTSAAENKYYAEYKSSGLKTNQANSSDVKDQRAVQQNLGQQRSLMEAKVMEAKAGLGIKPDAGQLQAAELKQSKIEASCASNKSYKTAMLKERSMQLLNTAPQMIGQLGQSLQTMVTSTVNAEAKLEEANQKEADFDLEQSKQLYSQAQDLINTARDTLKAIYQAESQLNQKIIQA